jgi:hypothetical protein
MPFENLDETRLFHIVFCNLFIYMDFVIPCKRRLRQGFPCACLCFAFDGGSLGRAAIALSVL